MGRFRSLHACLTVHWPLHIMTLHNSFSRLRCNPQTEESLLPRRFTFKLSPGQETESGLRLRSFFTLGPAEGIFVTPVLRGEE